MNEDEIVDAILGNIFSSPLCWKRPTLLDSECPHSYDLFDRFVEQREEAMKIARFRLTRTVGLEPSAVLEKLDRPTNLTGTREQRLLDQLRQSFNGLREPIWYAGGFETEEHKADFKHWFRMKWWDLDQATALSIGFEPRGEIVFDKLGLNVHYPARRFYEKRLALIRNNFQSRNGCFIQPNQFCLWAVSIKLPVRADFLEAANIILESDFALPDRKNKRSAKLENRERVALLKMVIDMAVKGYSFDPNANRSRTPQEISDDLALLGMTLDVKTIRKYLAEGTQLIPDSADRE